MPLNITILGLDAIGGSLGLALGTLDQDAIPGGRPVITGWDADRRTLGDARGRLMIDREARTAEDAVRDADIVFVCVPTTKLEDTFDMIAPHLKHHAIVSDVAGTKTQVIELASKRLPRTIFFVGGHPLVTPPRSSLEGAGIDLFKGVIYCLLPELSTDPRALQTIEQLITAIGAKPYYIEPQEHDAYVGGAQHLPIALSAALMETLSRSGGWREMQPVSGAALQVATELNGGDPARSSIELQYNRVALQRWLNDLIRTLVEMRDNLDHREQLEAMLSHAHEVYEDWMATQPNLRPGEREYLGESYEPPRGVMSLFMGQRRKRPGERGPRS